MVKFVVSTAMLECNLGTAPAPLIADLLNMSIGPGLKVASVRAHVPGVNIFPFGQCIAHNCPCVPVTPKPWSGGGAGVFFGSSEALSSSGKLQCTIGGIITVSDPGQHSVYFGELQDQYYKNANLPRARFLAQLSRFLEENEYEDADDIMKSASRAGTDEILILQDILDAGADFDDILTGSHLHIHDGGSLYRRWAKRTGAKKRPSSHDAYMTDERGVNGELAGGILLGLSKGDGGTRVQTEKSHFEWNVKSIPENIGHGWDFLDYKFFSKKNIGPRGKSEYTDKSPKHLYPKGRCP
jgi:hypothetical protein